MENISFLKQVLTSGKEYWIAARREHVNRYGKTERAPDSVWVICIPYAFDVHQKLDDLLIRDLEMLQTTNVPNIALSERYAPFQTGINMYHFYAGFPLEGDFREFLIKALECGSNKLDDYQKIWTECTYKPETLQTV